MMMTNVHHTRCSSRWLVAGALLIFAAGCSHHPAPRAPMQMEKIQASPGGGAPMDEPLALHSDIPATSSANDLDNSGPKVSEPPKQKAKTEPRLSDPEDFVPLTKHSSVPVGGNQHGHER
jgi:hypothetical protein